MDDYSLWGIGILAVCTMVEASFYGFGAAIQKVNAADLNPDIKSGNKKAVKALRIVKEPRTFVNTMHIVTGLLGMIMGGIVWYGFLLLWNQRMSKSMDEILQFLLKNVPLYILALIVFVSFGMVIPRRLGARSPKKWIYRGLNFVSFCMFLCLPFTLAIHAVSAGILKLFHVELDFKQKKVTEENIMFMVNEGGEDGVLAPEKVAMITNIIGFKDKKAEDVMTNRNSINAFDAQMTLGDAVEYVINHGVNSRYPVYQDEIDDIIGFVHMKDMFRLVQKEHLSEMKLGQIKGLLRDVTMIPETRKLDTLFQEMRPNNKQIVIVVDEYGQTAGLLTMEDIVEEIVGNIMDEYDVEEKMITIDKRGNFNMQGMTPLEEVAEILDIVFDKEELDNFDTLNGYLISLIDRIPNDGERFRVDAHGYHFRADKIEDRMIKSVKVSKIRSDKKKTKEDKKENPGTGLSQESREGQENKEDRENRKNHDKKEPKDKTPETDPAPRKGGVLSKMFSLY